MFHEEQSLGFITAVLSGNQPGRNIQTFVVKRFRNSRSDVIVPGYNTDTALRRSYI